MKLAEQIVEGILKRNPGFTFERFEVGTHIDLGTLKPWECAVAVAAHNGWAVLTQKADDADPEGFDGARCSTTEVVETGTRKDSP